MYEPSKNTVYIAIAFTSIAALVGAYSYWDDVSYALCDVVKPELNNGEVRLIDDEGKSYTLIITVMEKKLRSMMMQKNLLPFIVMRKAILYGMQA